MSLVSDALKQLQNGSEKSAGKLKVGEPHDGQRWQAPQVPPPPAPPEPPPRNRWKTLAIVLLVVISAAILVAGTVLTMLNYFFPETPDPLKKEEVSRSRAETASRLGERLFPHLQLPSRAAAPERGEQLSIETVEKNYQVTLIAKAGASAMAIVNNRVVNVGDQLVGGARVVDIQPRFLEIELEGQVYRLRPPAAP